MTAEPMRFPTSQPPSHAAAAWPTLMPPWSGATRVGETWAPGMTGKITGGPEPWDSAGKSRRGRECQDPPAAAVVQPPTVGDRQASGVAFAQVVVVRVTAGREIVEPDDRQTVLVRERR